MAFLEKIDAEQATSDVRNLPKFSSLAAESSELKDDGILPCVDRLKKLNSSSSFAHRRWCVVP